MQSEATSAREVVAARATAPRNITAAIGTQYFKQVVITWSMRSRGSVQRTHIITVHADDALER